MAKAVTDTSRLLYLYRIGKVDILPQVFEEVLTVPAVVSELAEGQAKGYEVPKPDLGGGSFNSGIVLAGNEFDRFLLGRRCDVPV